MRCAEVRNLLSNYIENDIDAKVKKSIDEHLASCANCAKELQDLKGILAELKNTPEVEPPPYFLEGVHARLEEQPSALAKLLRRLFVPFYIKVPVQALTIVATVIIITVLVQKEEMTSFKQLRVPVASQTLTQQETSSQQTSANWKKEERIDVAKIIPKAENIPLPAAKQSSKRMTGSVPTEMLYGQHDNALRASVAPAGSLALENRQQNMSVAQFSVNNSQSNAAITQNKLVFDKNYGLITEGYVARQSLKEQTSMAERKITIKTENLEQSVIKLNKILSDLSVTDIQTANYADKVTFNFQIPGRKLALFLSSLKDWQLLSPSYLEEIPEVEAALASVNISLILTTQQTP